MISGGTSSPKNVETYVFLHKLHEKLAEPLATLGGGATIAAATNGAADGSERDYFLKLKVCVCLRFEVLTTGLDRVVLFAMIFERFLVRKRRRTQVTLELLLAPVIGLDVRVKLCCSGGNNKISDKQQELGF